MPDKREGIKQMNAVLRRAREQLRLIFPLHTWNPMIGTRADVWLTCGVVNKIMLPAVTSDKLYNLRTLLEKNKQYLSGIELLSLNLAGINFSNADLTTAQLTGSCFDQADLEGSKLSFARGIATSFSGARMKGCQRGKSVFFDEFQLASEASLRKQVLFQKEPPAPQIDDIADIDDMAFFLTKELWGEKGLLPDNESLYKQQLRMMICGVIDRRKILKPKQVSADKKMHRFVSAFGRHPLEKQSSGIWYQMFYDDDGFLSAYGAYKKVYPYKDSFLQNFFNEYKLTDHAA